MQTGPFQPSDVVDVDRFRMKMLRALRCLRDAGRSAEDGRELGGVALYTEDVGRVFRRTLVMVRNFSLFWTILFLVLIDL